MKIANLYSHLNGYEYMLVHRQGLWEELQDAIAQIDANQYTKSSKEKTRNRQILYDQKAINKEFESILFSEGWKSVRTPYYVTGDMATAREIASLRNKEDQKKWIESKGLEAYNTYNQVDFVKEGVAVEVQCRV